MRIATIVGTVTLNRSHPSLVAGRLKLAVPCSLEDLMTQRRPSADELVVFDELGAGMGDLVMISEGAEAAQPFYPEAVPIDTYNAGIIDQIDLK